ncbi:hypothetical protein HDU90_002834 [Geranomyces variabilis]|nr:hypothetical protein HDU90_002834 [Geranomyces variabilis]
MSDEIPELKSFAAYLEHNCAVLDRSAFYRNTAADWFASFNRERARAKLPLHKVGGILKLVAKAWLLIIVFLAAKSASGTGDEYERLRTVHLRAEEAGREVASETTKYVLKLDQKALHQLQEASGPRFDDNLESANHSAGLRVPSPDIPSRNPSAAVNRLDNPKSSSPIGVKDDVNSRKV